MSSRSSCLERGRAPVIEVVGLGKCYHIYERPSHRLLQGLIGRSRQLFREFWALRNVNFCVYPGETLGIIGRNGSGKSTLLQMIAGTLAPTEGSISVNGRIAALLELGSGFNPEFSGRENVYLNAAILGLTKAEIDQRFQGIVDFADIGEFIEQPVRNYSSGMVMRLAFAVMAHVDADILVIDEALSVGDAFFTQKCMRYLREFQARGTLLFVSHDASAVTGLCQNAIWLDGGKLRASGAAKKVTHDYLEAFISEREGARASEYVEPSMESPSTPRIIRDSRQPLIDRSTLRNDITIPQFSPEVVGFGRLGATITEVVLIDEDDRRLPSISGGELVTLRVVARSTEFLVSPIVGFYVKDRLGQILFGDNTYLSTFEKKLVVPAGHTFQADFQFLMPRLQAGDYFITAGVAEGTQEEHVVQHWIHEALHLHSLGATAPAGIVGIPMQRIDLEIKP